MSMIGRLMPERGWVPPPSDAEKLTAITAQRDQLRAALVGLVGVDGLAELEQMEVVMRLMPAPAADKAATIDAIHALIATCVDTAKSGDHASASVGEQQSDAQLGANARLIAAAPDLLHACDLMRAAMARIAMSVVMGAPLGSHVEAVINEAQDAANAAVKKARGDQ